MSQYPDSVEQLIEFFRIFRGVGRRGAERYVLSLLDWQESKIREFGSLIAGIPDKVGHCPECGSLAEKGRLCEICENPRRDVTSICVVESFAQLQSIENSHVFKGVYHVLGGKISPLDDEYGENLNLASLPERIERNQVKEVIIALGADVEGRATALYISDMLKDCNVRVTQLSQGIPAGANIAFADSATIGAALKNRMEL